MTKMWERGFWSTNWIDIVKEYFFVKVVTQKISETVSSCSSSFQVFGHLFMCLVIFSSGSLSILRTDIM